MHKLDVYSEHSKEAENCFFYEVFQKNKAACILLYYRIYLFNPSFFVTAVILRKNNCCLQLKLKTSLLCKICREQKMMCTCLSAGISQAQFTTDQGLNLLWSETEQRDI